MSARADTWMPLYWGDYARDTGHLNAAGHGAYLMLIKHYWCSGAPLVDDDEELWRIACCDSKKEWLRLRPRIARFFCAENGILRHGRIDRELAKAAALSAAKAEGGRKGAAKRWPSDGKTNGIPMANPPISQWQDDAQSQLQSPSSVGSNEPPAGKPASRDPIKAIFDRGVAVFAKGGVAEPQARSLIAKWRRDAGDPAVMAAIMDCEKEAAVEPISYFVKCVEHHRKPRAKVYSGGVIPMHPGAGG